jgi:hypothetical protein
MTLLLSSSSSSSSLRRCIYLYFFHFNCCSCLCPDCDGVYRYATLCRCRSLSSFLRFFFDSIDARNSECSMLSFSPSCSVTIHFTRVLLCLSYSAPSCSISMCAICIFFGVVQKSKSSRHLYTGKIDDLFFWHWLNIIEINR